MSTDRICLDCGSKLPSDAPHGLCPPCLMRAAMTRGAGVLDTLDVSIGPVPRVLLRDTGVGETPGQVVLPSANPGDASSRYRIDGEIARGGMGAVLKGRDPDLGRDVALKVLHDCSVENLRTGVESGPYHEM